MKNLKTYEEYQAPDDFDWKGDNYRGWSKERKIAELQRITGCTREEAREALRENDDVFEEALDVLTS